MLLKKYKRLIPIIALFIIGILSFTLLFYSGLKNRGMNNKIKDEVISHLKNKYSRNFSIEDISSNAIVYIRDNCEEDCETIINGSHYYEITAVSDDVKFNVVYVRYDNNNFDKFKDYDIPVSGIYDDYIYKYKIDELNDNLKSTIKNNFKTYEWDTYFSTISNETIPIIYSLTSDEDIEKIERYDKLDLSISLSDYFSEFSRLNPASDINMSIDIKEDITKDNLENFKKRVKKLVTKIKDLGFSSYEINFTAYNYLTCQVSETEGDEIYLLFDYAIYSDISDSDKLTMYTYK